MIYAGWAVQMNGLCTANEKCIENQWFKLMVTGYQPEQTRVPQLPFAVLKFCSRRATGDWGLGKPIGFTAYIFLRVEGTVMSCNSRPGTTSLETRFDLWGRLLNIGRLI